MRVLVACEFSGIVRDAFLAKGHDAMSCDLLPSERPGPHYQGDVRDVLDGSWSMMIAFPPCQYIAVSGNRWHAGTLNRERGLGFAVMLMDADVPMIAIENPVSVLSRVRKPDQTIQPYEFGHGEVKRTCLWLKNLPPLVPTSVVDGREARVWRMGPSPTRSMDRSRTYPGIAAAMAEQWGKPLTLGLTA